MLRNDAKNGIAGMILGKIPYNAPNQLWFGVSTTQIANDGTGITEAPASSGYNRIAVDNTTASWTTPINGVVTNKNEIRMNEITVDSGKAVAYFFSDVASGGTAYLWDSFPVGGERPLLAFSTIYISPNDAKFSVLDISVNP